MSKRKVVNYAQSRNGKLLPVVRARCEERDCQKPFKAKQSTITALERYGKVRCPACRKKAEIAKKAARVIAAREAANPKDDFGVSDQTLRTISKQPEAIRLAAARIVRDYLRACLSAESPMDDLNRIWIEAVDVAQCEAKETPAAIPPPDEPFRRYHQCQSPLAEAA